ncbi:putative acetyltransferase EpsM [Methylobacterium phyllosphaerae]|uniref:Acetyltransferase EpsM n=1 Tax=Methylobacterium phyllosphaerae TaxID=418223 RepID=A0AAE8L9W4_9HYPH|nr:acetyltransferase [Methylobacterium phyllosphaerae]APT30095.1 putative acetyltransferase EpsM [Methylobacterium phyllosphaerae]SFH76643.1 sugar O-acyltransferase, sialic acid O-acetyltransferase NeuD family [Methylobacterium phyllosphaerae]
MTAPGQRLALIGGGGFSKEIAEVAQLLGYTVESTYSSQPTAQVGRYRGYLDELLTDRAEYDGVALAVGGVSRAAIQARAEIIAWLERHALPCPPLVSPHAIVSQGVALGVGAFVAHGVIVNVDAQLGRFCVVNTGAIIGHDATIGDNSTISPAAFIGGRCSIGADSLVGPLAKVLQGLKVGDRTIIGMGCTVLRAVPTDAAIWPRPDNPVGV